MSAPGNKVFIIGAGLIGWNVLELLAREKYNITAMVRRKEHGEQLKASGASEVVLGDLDDKQLITEQVAAHDMTLHMATADHLPSVEAVLEGVERRVARGLPTIFIHTSGGCVTDDGALGAFLTDKVYHDNVVEEMDSVPDTAPHRDVDLVIRAKHRQLGSKAKLAIMIPPTIYGINKRHGRLSIQVPILTRYALKHGFSGQVGEGKSAMSNVHVMDLARGYVVLLQHLERTASDDAGLVGNPYYFCEASGDEEPSWREVAELVGEGLHRAGVMASATPQVIPTETYGDLFGDVTGSMVGLNSRTRAIRLRELGWKPVEKSFRDSYLEDELPVILAEKVDRSRFSGYGGRVF